VPELGRTIGTDEDQPGREHVAVISDALWNQEFGRNPEVLGRPLHLNRETYTIIGVLPKEFVFPHEGDIPNAMAGVTETDVWIPLALSAKDKSDRADLPSGDAVIARLKPGVSVAQAQSELIAIESHLDPLYPAQWRGWTALVHPVVGSIIGPVEKMMWLLLGAVGLVLLIACGNVANLLLARAAGRMHEMGIRTWFAALAVFLAAVGLYGVMAYSVKQRTAEIGVRMALGSSAARTLAMVLREGVTLVVIGLLSGTAAAVAITRVLEASLYNVTPLDPATFVGVASLLLVFGAGASLIPAVHAMRIEPLEALRHE
jgi:hypothetical protein